MLASGRLVIVAFDASQSSRLPPSRSEIRLEVDGGIKVDNIAEVAAAGADTFVAGSAIFGAKDYRATIAAMRERIAAAG